MEEYQVTVKRKVEHECEECGEPATRRVTYLLEGARSNPASRAYGKDNISWCSDAEAFACEKHEKTLRDSAPQGYSWCSTFERCEKLEHMFWTWIEDKAATRRAEAAPGLLEACTMVLDQFIIDREGTDPVRDRLRSVLVMAICAAEGP